MCLFLLFILLLSQHLLSSLPGVGHTETEESWPLPQQCSEPGGGGRKVSGVWHGASLHGSLDVPGKGGCPVRLAGQVKGVQMELAKLDAGFGITGEGRIRHGISEFQGCHMPGRMWHGGNPVMDVD